jgi:hypothetical protein
VVRTSALRCAVTGQLRSRRRSGPRDRDLESASRRPPATSCRLYSVYDASIMFVQGEQFDELQTIPPASHRERLRSGGLWSRPCRTGAKRDCPVACSAARCIDAFVSRTVAGRIVRPAATWASSCARATVITRPTASGLSNNVRRITASITRNWLSTARSLGSDRSSARPPVCRPDAPGSLDERAGVD